MGLFVSKKNEKTLGNESWKPVHITNCPDNFCLNLQTFVDTFQLPVLTYYAVNQLNKQGGRMLTFKTCP